MSNEMNDIISDLLKGKKLDSILENLLKPYQEKVEPCSEVLDAHLSKALDEAVMLDIPKQMFAAMAFRKAASMSVYTMPESMDIAKIKILLTSTLNFHIDNAYKDRVKQMKKEAFEDGN
jgi:hypothetical protein